MNSDVLMLCLLVALSLRWPLVTKTKQTKIGTMKIKEAKGRKLEVSKLRWLRILGV